MPEPATSTRRPIAVDTRLNPISADVLADHVYELSHLVMQLGVEPRKTYHPDGKTRESVATHTLKVIIVACALADALNRAAGPDDVTFDVGMVAQEAAVHDLEEAIVGDTPTLQLLSAAAKARKHDEEVQARQDIVHRFLRVFPWFRILIPTGTEMVEGVKAWSKERRLGYFVDKLDPKSTHIANGCTSVREDGMTRAQLARRYAVQRAELLADVVYDFPQVIDLYDKMVARELEALDRA